MQSRRLPRESSLRSAGCGTGENTLFGYGDGNGAHFDATLADILKKENSSYADAYAEDLSKEDAEGHTVDYRLKMYSPLYYLMKNSEGYGTSKVADYFRINTGLFRAIQRLPPRQIWRWRWKRYDADGALQVNVDFTTVWGMGSHNGESAANAADNFIEWVNACCAQRN